MRFFSSVCLVLSAALGVPLLAGACAPTAMTVATTGADGASVMETGKSGADHLVSMVSKQDCAVFRTFRNQDVCRPRDDGHDPYDVNYNAPFRQVGEGGVEYGPPPRSSSNAPAASWDPAVYKSPPAAGSPNPDQPQPAAVTDPEPAKANAAPVVSPPAKTKKKAAGRAKVIKKKHARRRAASVP